MVSVKNSHPQEKCKIMYHSIFNVSKHLTCKAIVTSAWGGGPGGRSKDFVWFFEIRVSRLKKIK